MKEVTDPEILKQLEASPGKEVTDPAILSQLETPPEKSIGGFISNVGKNVADVAKGLATVVTHPFQTAENVGTAAGQIIRGGLEKLTGEPALPEQQAAFEKVSKPVVEAVTHPLKIPGMVFDYLYEKPVDTALIASGGLGLAGKAAKAGGLVRAGRVLETARKAIDPLFVPSKIPKVISKVWEKVVAPTIGSRALTGAETESVLRATKGSKGFTEGIRGKINPQGVFKEAETALDNIIENRRFDYRQKLPALQSSTTQIDITPVMNELTDQLKKFGVKFDQKGNIIRSTLERSSVKDAQEIIDLLNKWGTEPGDLTASGLDMLKRNLDNFYHPNRNVTAMTTPLRNKVKELIVKEVPEYAGMMEKYEKYSDTIKEIKQNLSMGTRSSTDSGIRKLMSSLRDDNEFRRGLIGALEDAGHAPLLDQIAGIKMRSPIPLQHGGTQLAAGEVLGAIFKASPKLLIGVGLASPRLMGEFLNTIGKAVNIYRKGKQAIEPIPSAIKKGVNIARQPEILAPVGFAGRVEKPPLDLSKYEMD